MARPAVIGPFDLDVSLPFAQRHDLMSLDTVQARDVPKEKILYPKSESFSLKTNDIERSRPTYDHLKYLNKPDVSVGCTDPMHDGGRAQTYYAPMDRRPRDLSLATGDIEGAQPRPSKMKGNRHTDPVCPNYEMPSSVQRPPTPPHGNGRHTLDTTDIDKSRPRVLHPIRDYARNPNDASDIDFAAANYRDRFPRHPHRPRVDRAFDVSDISSKQKAPCRGTNPIEPVYTIPTNKVPTSQDTTADARKEPEQIGEVRGARPRQLHRDNGEPQLSLVKDDIVGCLPQRWVGSVPRSIYDSEDVRPPVSFHDPGDIKGAQASTFKRGLESKRCVNPLNPRYKLLDGYSAAPVPTIDAERGKVEQSTLQSLRGSGTSASTPNLHSGMPLASDRPSLSSSRSASTQRQTPTGIRSHGRLPSGIGLQS